MTPGHAAAVSGSPAGRRTAPVSGRADWLRCTRTGTDVDPVRQEVLLARLPAGPAVPWPQGSRRQASEPAGLAFDRDGCLLHGVPERGQLQRLAWPGRAAPVDLLDDPDAPLPADGAAFIAVGGDPRRPLRARALAADDDEHLFVLDGATGAVAVLDLADGHLLRTVALPGTAVDLAAAGHVGEVVLALLASREAPLVRLSALAAPVPVPLRAGALDGVPVALRPSRLAVGPDGTVWVLLADRDPADDDAWVVPVAGPARCAPLRVPGATDLEVDGDGRLVVAGQVGGTLLVWAVPRAVGSGPPATAVAQPPLTLRGHDGRGLVRTPDGRVAGWTAGGLRTALGERARYVRSGQVDTWAIDSLHPGQTWGRVFVEACVPPGTQLLVGAAAADGPEQLPEPGAARPLHRRERGREVPWSPLPADDRYAVYEAPLRAGPGRFLVLRLSLTGPGTTTPRVRAVRIELPAHDLLDRLPRTYRRDPDAADFLHRYLALVDGQLGELEARAVSRDLLLDPSGAPTELLAWLGSLVGIVLDERWPEAARRTMLAQAVSLYRRRGTPQGLQQLLEIYLGAPVVVLEAFRLREPASPVAASGPSATAVGVGLRVGGGGSGADPAEDPFRAHAHRFSVLLTREVDDGELAVVHDLLDLHRPAHTVVEVCTLGGGMRVGVGLHVELSSVVGPGSGLRPLRVGTGGGVLGGDGVLGRGRAGVRPGASRLSSSDSGWGAVVDG